jgi:hypothetical protein
MDSSETLAGNEQATDAELDYATNEVQDSKTYSQQDLDNALAKLKHSLNRKFSKQIEELGDLNELKQLKSDAETRRVEEAKKRGEYDNLMKELASKKDAEIAKRDAIIREYKIDMPLVEAAAKHRAVAPEQVRTLLKNQLQINSDGEVEITDPSGTVRYNDRGEMMSVDELVKGFLDTNPHFVSATPATTATKSSRSPLSDQTLDISKLDMRNPEHRKQYAEHRNAVRKAR